MDYSPPCSYRGCHPKVAGEVDASEALGQAVQEECWGRDRQELGAVPIDFAREGTVVVVVPAVLVPPGEEGPIEAVVPLVHRLPGCPGFHPPAAPSPGSRAPAHR